MIRIGSRGSALARWQAEYVAEQLQKKGHEVSIQTLVTTGDRRRDPFLEVGVKGMFAKEIEEALTANRIDLAVHSLKDLPAEMAEEFALAAVPERADARDAFVSLQYESLATLPIGAVVGTSSLRRQAQLCALRPDLKIRELRGNVDTRLRKLQDGEYDAVVLACAGLDRLRRTEWIRERFAPQDLCPAAGQGALAVECRAADDAMRDLLAPLDDPGARFAVTAERAALATLEGGCHVPVGVHCAPADAGWLLLGTVAQPDGSRIVREQMHLDGGDLRPARAQEAGQTIARRLLDRGAGELLADTVSSGQGRSARGPGRP